jgi:hypothetical protein
VTSAIDSRISRSHGKQSTLRARASAGSPPSRLWRVAAPESFDGDAGVRAEKRSSCSARGSDRERHRHVAVYRRKPFRARGPSTVIRWAGVAPRTHPGSPCDSVAATHVRTDSMDGAAAASPSTHAGTHLQLSSRTWGKGLPARASIGSTMRATTRPRTVAGRLRCSKLRTGASLVDELRRYSTGNTLGHFRAVTAPVHYHRYSGGIGGLSHAAGDPDRRAISHL